MISTTIQTLNELATVLAECGQQVYETPIKVLGNSTIGQHTRHIVEMYQCVNNGYFTGEFSYDKRQRNKLIETNLHTALNAIDEICLTADKENIDLKSYYILNDSECCIATNYHRELMYNLEHCIHHQALIRVGIEAISSYQLSSNFGVAPSTISYRETCVQ
jgi:hypothetical protein